jgi:hypothetical protein
MEPDEETPTFENGNSPSSAAIGVMPTLELLPPLDLSKLLQGLEGPA